MDIPYIKLSGSRIDPGVIDEILNVVWDHINDDHKKMIVEILNDYNVDHIELN